jgi:hypothetical protein
MKSDYLLGDPEAWKRLAENLARCEEVTKFDRGQDQEAWTLAHAFADLEESFRKLLENYFPKLLAPEIECGLIHDVLLDIGEELRHILYHIKDPRFFAYLDEADTGSFQDGLIPPK